MLVRIHSAPLAARASVAMPMTRIRVSCPETLLPDAGSRVDARQQEPCQPPKQRKVTFGGQLS
jgi:hypothetical protein